MQMLKLIVDLDSFLCLGMVTSVCAAGVIICTDKAQQDFGGKM